MATNKRNYLTLEKKVELIKHVQRNPGMSVRGERERGWHVLCVLWRRCLLFAVQWLQTPPLALFPLNHLQHVMMWNHLERERERLECLIIVAVSWADTGYHDDLCVASQGGLQETSQLGVSVGNMRDIGMA